VEIISVSVLSRRLYSITSFYIFDKCYGQISHAVAQCSTHAPPRLTSPDETKAGNLNCSNSDRSY
jgi:hypothetical protein